MLVIFLAFFTDFLVLYRRKHGAGGVLRRLRVFLGFMFAAVGLILVRCVYRIVELKDGYFGEEFRKEWEFVGLEGG